MDNEMNIEEIRTEIPSIFLTQYRMKRWLHENGVKDGYSMLTCDAIPLIAQMLVDMAYEAGKFEGQKGGVLFNAAKQVGFDEAAGDPKAWYVPDKNGEKVHIGDKFKRWDGKEFQVFALKPAVCWGPSCVYLDGEKYLTADMTKCEKVFPGTREKIKDDLSALLEEFYDEAVEREGVPIIDRLWPSGMSSSEVAEQFISRIEALVD